MRIAIDADGVLLDQKAQTALIYEKVLNRKLYFNNIHDIECSLEEMQEIKNIFDIEGWTNMPAMKGALEATRRLHDDGHFLFCMSPMPEKYLNDRKKNIIDMRMPLGRLIVTNKDETSPFDSKAEQIEDVSAEIFIDDQLINFRNVSEKVCKIWINNGYDDTPHIGKTKSLANFEYPSLLDFTYDFIDNPKKFRKIA